MTSLRGTRFFVGWTIIGIFLTAAGAYAQDMQGDDKRIPEGVHIKLTKEFYHALRHSGKSGVKIYSNDPSHDYLREIAVSSRFMVETNLELLKQQERLIHLLQSLLKSPGK